MTGVTPTSAGPSRVILHAGPHKTGTTTIQTALAAGGDFIYPVTERKGPGHADLAQLALGVGPYAGRPHPDALLDAVRTAKHRRASSTTAVLSSEAFLGAIRSEHGALALSRLASAFPTELVLTLRPDHERLAAVAAELLVGGRYHELVERWQPALKNATLQPGIVPRFMAIAPWSAVHVILVSTEDHEHLFRSFERIIRAPLIRIEAQNTRWPALALIVMGALTQTNPELPLVRRRQLALKAAANLADEPESEAITLPPIPDDVLTRLRNQWETDLREIRVLAKDGRIRLHERSRSDDGSPTMEIRADRVLRQHEHPPDTSGSRASQTRRRLVLHVGPAKTGTSALQVFFAQNTVTLERLGLRYPDRDGSERARKGATTSGNGRSIALHFARSNTVVPRSWAPDHVASRSTVVAELVALTQAPAAPVDSGDVLLSSEYFGELSNAAIDDLASTLEGMGIDVHIISTLRDPVDMLRSIYAQNTKGAKFSGSLEDFWGKIGRALLQARLAMPLRYADRFGDDSVSVIPYTPPESDPHRLVKDFLAAASDASPEFIERLFASGVARGSGPVHRSPGPIAIEILRRGTSNGMSPSLVQRIAVSLSQTAPDDVLPFHSIPSGIVDEVRGLASPILADIGARFGVQPLPLSEEVARSADDGGAEALEYDWIARALIAAFDNPSVPRVQQPKTPNAGAPAPVFRRPWLRRLRRRPTLRLIAAGIPRPVRRRLNAALDQIN